ncbi:MAG: hypothetical protein IT175_04970 [Acidobacteria bacterium]|nr:hypothetical protein [Acidobacteriota bacterium]
MPHLPRPHRGVLSRRSGSTQVSFGDDHRGARLGPADEPRGPRHPLYGRYDDAESFRFAPYATDYFGLFVKATADTSWEGCYGYRLEYEDVFFCDLERAEMMVRTLKRLQRQMDRFRLVEGAATTFGQYVNRVARALRCTRVCIRQDGCERICFHTSPGDSVDAIDSIVKHWHEARRAGATA